MFWRLGLEPAPQREARVPVPPALQKVYEATLEAIAYEVRDVVDVMAAEAGGRAPLRVDGGAAANDLLMQLQADQLQVPVERPVVAETTGLGAAFLAGLATGVWSSTEELAATWRLDERFEPGPRDDSSHKRWREAVRRSRGWAGADGAARPAP